ncbi:MAG TPA: transporter substrate-binding domain-containing protein [Thermodesulfobacteriota bacterium]|nr:transporter substrate-binding domain-containing protein [Thermodesulfobacteriota bacterium]
MGKARNWVTWGVAVGLLVSLWGQALGAGESAKVSPVLDRIMAKKELIVGTAASMPPLNMTTKEGEIIGAEIDLARAFASAMEVKLTLSRMPFNELLPALEKGQVDMILSGMTMTPQRNLKVAFVGPYFASGKSILTKKKNVESVDEIAKMNQPDKVLVALKGSTSQLFVEKLIPKAKLVLADNYDQAVANVRNDQAVAMVADYPICMLSVYRYPDAGFITLGKPISYEPVGVALPANDPLLINWVQNSLNFLDKSGELEALMSRWFKDTSWLSRLP